MRRPTPLSALSEVVSNRVNVAAGLLHEFSHTWLIECGHAEVTVGDLVVSSDGCFDARSCQAPLEVLAQHAGRIGWRSVCSGHAAPNAVDGDALRRERVGGGTWPSRKGHE